MYITSCFKQAWIWIYGSHNQLAQGIHNVQANYYGWSNFDKGYVFSFLGPAGEIRQILDMLDKRGIDYAQVQTLYNLNISANGLFLVDILIDPEDASYIRLLCAGWHK